GERNELAAESMERTWSVWIEDREPESPFRGRRIRVGLRLAERMHTAARDSSPVGPLEWLRGDRAVGSGRHAGPRHEHGTAACCRAVGPSRGAVQLVAIRGEEHRSHPAGCYR